MGHRRVPRPHVRLHAGWGCLGCSTGCLVFMVAPLAALTVLLFALI